jgi:2,4-dienoyl-CoA reductase-like NADH-dependent reductase (Old Yellow Enzyme family)
VENRQRFLLETIDAVAEAVGNSHVAVRLSPFGRIYDLAPYEGEEQTWSAITDALGQRDWPTYTFTISRCTPKRHFRKASAAVFATRLKAPSSLPAVLP